MRNERLKASLNTPGKFLNVTKEAAEESFKATTRRAVDSGYQLLKCPVGGCLKIQAGKVVGDSETKI